MAVVQALCGLHNGKGERTEKGKTMIVMEHNAGAHRSPPTSLRLESAPLGAFVPWQPLTRMLVPPLEAGESRELSTEVVRSRPASLGDFKRVPPKRLFAAANSR